MEVIDFSENSNDYIFCFLFMLCTRLVPIMDVLCIIYL